MAVQRFDSGRLDQFQRTAAGGFKIPATIARTGIQIYTAPDGTKVREYRSPEEVFSVDSLASLADAPVTIGHPKANGINIAVTPLNRQRLAHGHVRGQAPDKVKVDGDAHDWVSTDLLVTAADAQSGIESGELCETSGGYMCDHDETPGTDPEGNAYDRKQIKIRYNHIALLGKGRARAGENAKLRLDGDQELIEPEPAIARHNLEKVKTMKVTVDGIEYESGSESHVAALKKLLADSTEKLETANTEAGANAVKLDELEKSLAKATEASSSSKIDERVTETLEFRAKASTLLSDEYDFTGKTEHQVRVDAIDEKYKDRPEEFVKAAFEMKLDSIEKPEDEKAGYKVDEKPPLVDGFDHKAHYEASFNKGAK